MAKRFRLTAILLGALTLAGCKQQNAYAPVPPAKVTVALPVQKKITRYLEVTGNTAAVNSVDLTARVQGFLDQINYVDGTAVKKGAQLFVIEPLLYWTKLQQATAAQESAQAALTNSQIELSRQQTLVRQDVAAQRALDDALSKRDQAQGDLDQAKANTQIAAINYSYTRVTAPFDGVVSEHLQSVGQLVGTTPTTLATIVQQDPIYVNFTVSEQSVLRIRADLRRRGLGSIDLNKVPVEIGLQNEQGYPHTGNLDYVAPSVNQSTGTLQVRGVLPNADHTLVPGYYARVRVPVERNAEALLVPNTATGSDQAGRYVLVVNQDGIVEQRHVELGEADGEMRVVLTGLKPDERVVISGVQRAVPGAKVDVQTSTAAGAKP
jgi:RND family efflux transporter MFP subunit